MAIAFITWLWGTKYNADDVARLAHAVRRNHRADHRFVVFTNQQINLPPPIEVKPIANPELIGRGCFCRLRMFDPEWQRQHGFDGRIAALDLDLLVTGNIDAVFVREQTFLILQGVNAVNPCPYNCSMMMLRAGQHAEVWQDFSQEKAAQVTYHEFPDDQGWIWHKLPNAAGWTGGKDGIYAFQKPGWPRWAWHALPIDARIVAFIGWRKPKLFTHLPWVRENWRST